MKMSATDSMVLKVSDFAGFYLRPRKSATYQKLHCVYTFTIGFIVIFKILSEIFDLVISSKDFNDFLAQFTFTISATHEALHFIQILRNRQKIKNIVNILLSQKFLPYSQDEISLQVEYDKIIWSVAKMPFDCVSSSEKNICSSILRYISVAAFVGMNGVVIALMSTPFFYDSIKRPLPLRMWIPFGMNQSNYWILYFFQVIHTDYACYWAFGTYLIGWMFLQVNLQYDFMTLRLKELNSLSKDLPYHDKKRLEQIIIANNLKHEIQVMKLVIPIDSN